MNRGAALILTLWCVAILSITIVSVARMVDLDVESASLQSKKMEARQLALSGIALGLNPQIERDDQLLRQTIEGVGNFRVALQSENARININRVLKRKDDRTLMELLEYWEVPDEARRVVVDSLRDWVDENDIRSLNGAEAPDLQGQDRYSLPKNRDFISVDEMERVKGMEAVIAAKPSWDEMFSVFSTGKFDIQDASEDILRAMAGLSTDQAQRLIEIRNGPDFVPYTDDDYYFESIDDAALRVGVGEQQRQALASKFGVKTEPTRIVSVGEVGDVRHEIVAIVQRGGGGGAREPGSPIAGGPVGVPEILHWEEK